MLARHPALAPRAAGRVAMRVPRAQDVKTTEAPPAPAAEAPPPPPPPAKAPLPPGKAELYVGKGRTVVDDPALYPDRTPLTGGWAGGEVGLKAWAAANAPAPGERKQIDKAPPPKGAKPAKAGGPGIYIGRGLVVDDDPAKYADKESLGPLANVTGGFAGGEKGVQAFAATGKVELAPQPVRQFSPLAFAVLVAAVGTGGGLLLNSGVTEVEELAAGGGGSASGLASSAAALASVDGGTRALLVTGVGLAAVAAGVAAVRGAVKGAQVRAASAAAGAVDAVKAAAFWVAVFVAAKLVIENS